MPPDRHYRMLHVAGEEQPPIVVLSVIVVEAEGLEAKDANGELSHFWPSELVQNENLFAIVYIGFFLIQHTTKGFMMFWTRQKYECRQQIHLYLNILSTASKLLFYIQPYS